MSLLHIANTNFEAELASSEPLAITTSIQTHPIFMQLQFLPLIYGDSKDGLAVTHAPHPSFNTPQWHLFDEKNFPYDKVESWGASRNIAAWAARKSSHMSCQSGKLLSG